MSIKLNDTQLLLLSGASQREDGCAAVPTGAKRRSALRAASRLLEAGLLKEVRAKAETPIWRRDEVSGLTYSVKLTAAGAKAIAVEGTEAANDGSEGRQNASAVAVEQKDEGNEQSSTIDAAPAAVEQAHSAPRGGTKIAQVVTLLERRSGATLEELIAMTGWLPHTTRAALTGLRKRGYAVTLDQSDKPRGSVYRIAATEVRHDEVPSANTPSASEAPAAPPDAADRKRTRRAA